MGKPEEGCEAMEPVFSGFVLDPAKCNQLSLEEKRELVHEIAQWSEDAPEILRSWSRPELLEIICAEMGKVRKYTGFTKSRMIEHLLKLVSVKSDMKKLNDNTTPLSATKTQSGFKRQRKTEHPVRLVSDSDHVLLENSGKEQLRTLLCQNLACRATLNPEDAFCKRCTCCICYQFDDNKDPSLWLTCSSDPNQDTSCGMSCHLECTLKHERAGITKNGCSSKLDGGFYCVSCGKVNELMGSWRKQLINAKDARRVDVLCHRLSLSHEILKGTERYKEAQKILDNAVKILKNEVGPLDQVSSTMARGIVKRLSCGTEVQKLCLSAVESIDSMLSGINPGNTNLRGQSCNIRFEDASPSSVVVVLEYNDKFFGDSFGCRLWHRRSTAMYYPEKPAYLVLRPQKKFLISNLDPSTEYFFRVSMFNNTGELGVWEANYVTQRPNGSPISGLSGQHGKGEALMAQSNSQRDSTNSCNNKLTYSDDHSELRLLDDTNKNDEFQLLHNTNIDAPLVGSTSIPPSTPSKSDGTHEVLGSGGKKQNSESNYEYCVRVIRWLEREGHLKKDFRVRFLTWFSLKSTMQEKRVVSAFVDTLIDDPSSLADQLIDTFMDEICNERKPTLRFCTRLWH